jgi:hypothetical protein
MTKSAQNPWNSAAQASAPGRRRRLPSVELSFFLTTSSLFVLAGLAGLASITEACGPVVNDWSGHTAAAKRSYRVDLPAGGSASDLLSGSNFKKLTVEIQSVRGFAPSQLALDHFRNFLAARLNKPGGINIEVSGDLPAASANPGGAPGTGGAGGSPAVRPYSLTDIQALETRYRRHYARKDELTLYVAFLDGSFAADVASGPQSLAEAHGNTSIAVFEAPLRAAAAGSPAVPAWVLEASVLEHELGKLAGLVHAPIADLAHHEDQHHPGHCQSSNCLMNFNVETTAWAAGVTGATGSALPPELDANCLQDLKAAGGK